MLVASASVVGFNCSTPAASFWRTPPSRPRCLVAVCRRARYAAGGGGGGFGGLGGGGLGGFGGGMERLIPG
jgi:hypothetical protein